MTDDTDENNTCFLMLYTTIYLEPIVGAGRPT